MFSLTKCDSFDRCVTYENRKPLVSSGCPWKSREDLLMFSGRRFFSNKTVIPHACWIWLIMAKSARASLAIYEWSTYKEHLSGYTNLRFCKYTSVSFLQKETRVQAPYLKLMSFFGRGKSGREGFLLYLILVMHFVNHPLTSRFLKNAVEKMDNTIK